MYTHFRYEGKHHIDHEIFFNGSHGGRKEKRGKRDRSPEKVREWDHRKKVKRVRRTIQLNFNPGDPFITLKYPKGERHGMDKVKEHFKAFRDILRKVYRKQGLELKYIYAIEIGTRGGLHIHIVLNKIPDMLEVFTIAWQKARGTTTIEDMIGMETSELPGMVRLDGKVDMQLLYLEGGYQDLAEYLCKPAPNEEGMTPEEKKKVKAFNMSRNLIQPEPERREYTHWTVRRILEAGPEKINTDPALRKRYLSPGCIIDKSTWHTGINPVTGLSYIEFTEVRIT
jgi:hypothetical protein